MRDGSPSIPGLRGGGRLDPPARGQAGLCGDVRTLKVAYARKGYALVGRLGGDAASRYRRVREAGRCLGHVILSDRRVGETVADEIESARDSRLGPPSPGIFQRGGPPSAFDRVLASPPRHSRRSVRLREGLRQDGCAPRQPISWLWTSRSLWERFEPSRPELYESLTCLFSK